MTSKQPAVAFLSLQNSLIEFGIRYVSAACRREGIRSEIVFCLRDSGLKETAGQCEAVARWIAAEGFHAAGIGLMSLHVSRAVALTRAIHDIANVPVIWGGIHPILDPDACLEHADYVCLGDGERAVPEWVRCLANGLSVEGIDNIRQRGGSTNRTLLEDLDAIPYPDYDIDHHHLLDGTIVRRLTLQDMRSRFPWNLGRHFVISSRGCPHECAYCCNSALRKLFGQSHALRTRSVGNFMGEIDAIRDRYPFVNTFAIMDDSFFFKPGRWIDEFCEAFARTGCAFGCLIHPSSVTVERMDKLVRAGLIGVQMGLQSGSQRVTREVFHRHGTVEEFVRAAGVLDQYMDRLQARTYDVIVDNPYETDSEQEDTIRVLMSLNKPFNLDIFSLTFFPGTGLHDRRLREGYPESSMRADDRDTLGYRPTYLNRLTWLTHLISPRRIRFFLSIRKTWYGPIVFFLYDRAWHNGLRAWLRRLKRAFGSAMGRAG